MAESRSLLSVMGNSLQAGFLSGGISGLTSGFITTCVGVLTYGTTHNLRITYIATGVFGGVFGGSFGSCASSAAAENFSTGFFGSIGSFIIGVSVGVGNTLLVAAMANEQSVIFQYRGLTWLGSVAASLVGGSLFNGAFTSLGSCCSTLFARSKKPNEENLHIQVHLPAGLYRSC